MSNTRKTLKDFLNSIGEGGVNRIVYRHDDLDGVLNRGDDLGIEPNLNRELLDLDVEGSGLLGDYLSYIVEESSNTFKLDPGNEKAATSKRGDSLALAEEQGASNVYVNQSSEEYPNFTSYSNSGKLESEEPLQDIIDKTGLSSNSHNLLRGVPGRNLDKTGRTDAKRNIDIDNSVLKASKGLLKNNRFANVKNSQAFADRNTDNQDFDSDSNEAGTLTLQDIYSVYNKNANKTSFDSLKQIASSLILKASGFDKSLSPERSAEIEDLEKEIFEGEASNSILNDSGFFDTFVKINQSRFAKGFPSGRFGQSVRKDSGETLQIDPEAKNARSYGVLFNHAMKFDSNNNKMLRIQTSLVIVALVNAVNDLLSVFQPIVEFKKESLELDTGSPKVKQKDNTYRGRGPYLLGEHLKNLNNDIHFLKNLVLVDTIYPYDEAVKMGVKVLFGEDNQDANKIKEYSHIGQAPGFWYSVASSVLKSASRTFEQFEDIFASDITAGSIRSIVRIMGNSSVLKFMNTCATIGDIFLQSTGGHNSLDDLTNVRRVFDVDSFPDNPATRVMKSRSKGGTNELSLAWRQGSVSSMYLLPSNVINAVVDLNTLVIGQNPVNGMLGSGLVKETYVDAFANRSYNRIPNYIVKQMEDKLDAEYVPFYIQDLRTNEIIAFHAFLTKLSDSITPSYGSSTGYGRMDAVKTYQTTTRKVGVTFHLVATSKEDFDEMWFKINKLTTLMYPQWTQGTMVSNVAGTIFDEDINSTFIQPFSQVLGATPLVRMRVGDVIKSNYSRFNLSRIFGIGDLGVSPVSKDEEGFGSTPLNAVKNAKGIAQQILLKTRDVKGFEFAVRDALLILFYTQFSGGYGLIDAAEGKAYGASPLARTPIARLGFQLARNAISGNLINGFVNPKGASQILTQLADPNEDQSTVAGGIDASKVSPGLVGNVLNSIRGDAGGGIGYPVGSVHFLKTTAAHEYLCKDNGHSYRIDRSLRVLIKTKPNNKNKVELTHKHADKKDAVFKGKSRTDFDKSRKSYEVLVIDMAAPKDLYQKTLFAYHTDILPNPAQIFKNSNGYTGLKLPAIASSLGGVFADEGFIANPTKESLRQSNINSGLGTELTDIIRAVFASSAAGFMDPSRNPITRAYETTAGRGLAGTLGGLSFDWLEAGNGGWETDWNSRAPKGVTISLDLDVIHDLPPGLDHSGFNRAPLYNVGSIMKHVAGDPYEDNGEVSEHTFKVAGKEVNRKVKK